MTHTPSLTRLIARVTRMFGIMVLGITVLGVPSPAAATASSEGAAELAWEADLHIDDAGRAHRSGTLRVPEQRGVPSSRTITVPVRHFVASGEAPLHPIFFLAGGPGQSNLDYRPPLALLERHDVILVGFRGVDGAVTLDCPEVERALVDTGGNLLSEASKEAFTTSAMACAARLTAAGIDLAGYTMTEVVDDLEAVRRHLDRGPIHLLSASYGTRLAQIYAARHPDALHRSLMIGVNPPGRMLWDAAATDEKLARWSTLCAEDPECSSRTDNLAETMRGVFHDLPEAWMGFPIDPGKVQVALFCFFFHVDTAVLAIDSILAAADGDPSGLALISLAFDHLLPPMMVWGDFLAKGGTSGDFTETDPSPSEAANPVLGSPLSALVAEAARQWPAPPIAAEYHAVRASALPTLMVGGALDVSTPPEHARRQLLPSLSRGHQLTLENLGHVADVLSVDPEARDTLLTTFFATGGVRSHFAAPPPRLQPRWGFPRIAWAALGLLGLLLISALTLSAWLLRRRRRRQQALSTRAPRSPRAPSTPARSNATRPS